MASERENIARPPTTSTTASPTTARCGGPCRSADRRTHMCRRGSEGEDSGGSENAANIFGATARTRSSSYRRRCQRQRRRCYFVLVVSTVDTKSKKHFTTMSIFNMATLHSTHTCTHARTRTYTHVHAHHTLAPLCRQCVVASVCEREREREQNDLNDNCEKSLNLHLYFTAAISGVALQLLHVLLLLLFLSLFCFLLFFARHTRTHTHRDTEQLFASLLWPLLSLSRHCSALRAEIVTWHKVRTLHKITKNLSWGMLREYTLFK